MEDHPHTNSLINETSPYLLQHAHNPVNWYAWGEEALEIAKRENKLIIVSIGYSSCHWCHVMEHESFKDSTVAALMNEYFICIKVDREERPDIDNLYMTAVHLLNQQGGWPLNCITLPDGRPIWGGTYFPKEQWMEVLRQVSEYYAANPEKTRTYAAELADGIRQNSVFQLSDDGDSSASIDIGQVIEKWSGQFDKEYGGSQGAPKFPMPVNLEFLIHYGFQYDDHEVLDHVDLTLTKMANGGIYDQVGGGFARYSVDPIWKVPHFEKMLYDNAQLIGLYSKAYQVFGKNTYREAIQQSIEFIEREMVSDEGAFYSALDADSEGIEGKYYVWNKEELERLMEEDFELFADYYNVNKTGLWEHGSYILYRTKDAEEFSKARGMDYQHFLHKIRSWNDTLLKARQERIPPGLDDKSLTSWSSMMISGLVQAYRALGKQKYFDLAVTSASLIRDKLWTKEGTLYRNYKEGRRTIPAFHIDYALYIKACIDLYATGMDQDWLDLAVEMTEVTIERFYDPATRMYNFSGDDSEVLITNNVEIQDNVIPSSNSVMALNLFNLGHLLTNRKYLEQSSSMMKLTLSRFEQYPSGFANWGRLWLKHVKPFYEVAVVGTSARSILDTLIKEYIPNAIVVGSEVESTLPIFSQRFENDKTRIFVCQDNVCLLPVENPEDAKALYHTK